MVKLITFVIHAIMYRAGHFKQQCIHLVLLFRRPALWEMPPVRVLSDKSEKLTNSTYCDRGSTLVSSPKVDLSIQLVLYWHDVN